MAREKRTPASRKRNLRSRKHPYKRPHNSNISAPFVSTPKRLPPPTEAAKINIAKAVAQAFFGRVLMPPTQQSRHATREASTEAESEPSPTPSENPGAASIKRALLVTLISKNWSTQLSTLIPNSIYPRLPRNIKIRGLGFYEQRKAPPETWPFRLLTFLLEMSRMIPDAKEAVKYLVLVNHGRRRGKIRQPEEMSDWDWKREKWLMELGALDVELAVGEWAWVTGKDKGKGKGKGKSKAKAVEREESEDEDEDEEEEDDETEEETSGSVDDDTEMENDEGDERSSPIQSVNRMRLGDKMTLKW